MVHCVTWALAAAAVALLPLSAEAKCSVDAVECEDLRDVLNGINGTIDFCSASHALIRDTVLGRHGGSNVTFPMSALNESNESSEIILYRSSVITYAFTSEYPSISVRGAPVAGVALEKRVSTNPDRLHSYSYTLSLGTEAVDFTLVLDASLISNKTGIKVVVKTYTLGMGEYPDVDMVQWSMAFHGVPITAQILCPSMCRNGDEWCDTVQTATIERVTPMPTPFCNDTAMVRSMNETLTQWFSEKWGPQFGKIEPIRPMTVCENGGSGGRHARRRTDKHQTHHAQLRTEAAIPAFAAGDQGIVDAMLAAVNEAITTAAAQTTTGPAATPGVEDTTPATVPAKDTKSSAIGAGGIVAIALGGAALLLGTVVGCVQCCTRTGDGINAAYALII